MLFLIAFCYFIKIYVILIWPHIFGMLQSTGLFLVCTITLSRQADPLTTQTSCSLKPIFVDEIASGRYVLNFLSCLFFESLSFHRERERVEIDLSQKNRSDLFSKKTENNSQNTLRRICYRLPYRCRVRPEIVGKLLETTLTPLRRNLHFSKFIRNISLLVETS